MAEQTPDDIIKQIELTYLSLSPSGKKIAHYLQQNPIAVLSQSTSQIAESTGTSKATVSRLFRQLGFASHQEAKAAQSLVRQQGVPLGRAVETTEQIQQEITNVSGTLEGIDAHTLTSVANLLAGANQLTIIGYRNAYPLALHFRQQLMQIRRSVSLLPQPGQTIGEDIVDVNQDDIVILFGFRRRTRQFSFVLDAVKHARVILITDPTGQAYKPDVEHLLVCQLGETLPFDSYAAPMSLISTLCNLTYEKLGDAAAKRVNTITDTYVQLDELANPKL
ncbi:MurR/RpiR family transcriptional regulator [Alteromonas sp. A079]|uniref:MurR/RpiR family transcriptional regulator n=1 Tax=Alteromonas sp. A079 TaxID=3410268 RepID=UPI003BA29F37